MKRDFIPSKKALILCIRDKGNCSSIYNKKEEYAVSDCMTYDADTCCQKCIINNGKFERIQDKLKDRYKKAEMLYTKQYDLDELFDMIL